VWLPTERFGVDGAEPSRAEALRPALDQCLAKAPSLAASTPPRP
jgi:hypothetical protein